MTYSGQSELLVLGVFLQGHCFMRHMWSGIQEFMSWSCFKILKMRQLNHNSLGPKSSENKVHILLFDKFAFPLPRFINVQGMLYPCQYVSN